MVGEEILLEIDSTLDRLICNAEAIGSVNLNELSETELEAFQKTQESLLQHLMHMDQYLETKTKNLRTPNKKSAQSQIAEKFLKFERLKSSYHENVHRTLSRKSELMSKRRCKRLLVMR